MVITKESSFLWAYRLSLLFIFLLVSAVCLPGDAAPLPDQKNPPKTIKVVMDNNYPPYVFSDGKGNLQGILIDQWRLWEQKTGIRVDISGMDWGEALSRMGAGEFDVIDTIFFNERRAQIYDFSKPYAKIDVSIFFHKSISGISGTNSLQGFAVAVKSGDNAIDHLRGKGISLFQEYTSYEAIVRAAKEQKVMVTVIDNPPALYFLYKMGLLDQFRYSAPLYTGEFHRAVRKGNTAILKLVEEGFLKISESEYQAIHRKWFGTEASVFHPYVRHIAIGLGGLIIIVLSLIVWNRTLRKKVHERTLRLEEEITLNIKKTEAVQVSEEKYRELVENANSIILRMDPTGTITFFNEYASLFLGFSRDEIIGRNVVGTIVPSTDSAGKDLAQMILNIGVHPEQYKNNENENMCKDGRRVWVTWTNKPILDDQGRCVEMLCIGNDITDRKKAEEEKKNLQGQLSQAQRMEFVGRLAGGVAHDFNNMLSVILGHTELALQQVDPEQPLHDNLEEVHKAAERSADLTRQLLAFARKQTIAPRILDLNETIDVMLKMLRRLIGEDIDLAWIPSRDLWQVKIDPAQIDQILVNLLVNARDAIAGVGKITIETENVEFDVAYCTMHFGFIPGEYVELAASDTGCGMDRETLTHIFEPFFTTKETGKGTGLGMATVYGIVKQNNGFINVYSEPGKGTTFKIYLPRYAGKTIGASTEGPAEVTHGGLETILLVEDEPSILKLGKTILEGLGYRVLAAGTPGEAISLAEKHAGEIHLLMTDVVMPEMNGRDLAKKLLSLYPDLKRLFMSGYTANVIAHHGILDEGVYFIQKPFSIKNLAAKVREALDHE